MVIVTRIASFDCGESFVFNTREQANAFIERDYNVTVAEEIRESEFLKSHNYVKEGEYACIVWRDDHGEDTLEWMITFDDPNIVAIEAYSYDFMKRLP